MIRTKDEIIAQINALVGDNTSDDVISLVEDVADSFESFAGAEDWRAKYEENDAAWRQKYLERFSRPAPAEDPEEIETTDDEEITKFEDLFKEE